MVNGQDDPGTSLYSEERSITREKLRFIFIGISIILLVGLIIYVGTLHSGYLAVLAFILFGILLYPVFLALVIGFTGIHKLRVLESGFYPPLCSNVWVNLRKKGFIPWEDVTTIFSNKNLRVSKIFPYVVVVLKDTSFAIPMKQITNMGLFLSAIQPYTDVVWIKEYRNSRNPIEYYPPSNGARLDDDAIVLSYTDEDVRFDFSDVKKVHVQMSHQLVLNDKRRIGLLGMSREDIMRIKDNLANFRKKTNSDSDESEPDTISGLLKSSLDED